MCGAVPHFKHKQQKRTTKMTKNEWRETCLALADEFLDWAT